MDVKGEEAGKGNKKDREKYQDKDKEKITGEKNAKKQNQHKPKNTHTMATQDTAHRTAVHKHKTQKQNTLTQGTNKKIEKTSNTRAQFCIRAQKTQHAKNKSKDTFNYNKIKSKPK